MSFDEYLRLSSVITLAEISGAGIELSKAMYEQMIIGKEALEIQLNAVLTAEEKEELEKALTEAKQELEDFEKEMDSDEYANIKHNFELILKIREDLDI